MRQRKPVGGEEGRGKKRICMVEEEVWKEEMEENKTIGSDGGTRKRKK